MQIKDITNHLEQIAPPAYQEDYDNAGLLVGEPNAEAQKALICLDCTEAVIDEAVKHDCNLVISHHPLIFKPINQLTGRDHVQRTVMKAIKNEVAVYAIHTNLDNVYRGVNAKISEKLKLTDLEILAPKQGKLKKLTAQCSKQQAKALREVLQQAGITGKNSGQGGKNTTTPPVTSPGGKGRRKHVISTPSTPAGFGRESGNMTRLETVFPAYLEPQLTDALLNQNEVPSGFRYEITPLDNISGGVGSGMIGRLKKAVTEQQFLKRIKKEMKAEVVRHTAFRGKKVKKVAVCGGAGSFLLSDAIKAGANVFVTADFKYHDFFNAEGQLVIADIGHYESEQYTIDLLYTFLQQKFPNFAVRKTEVNTNPVHYF
jgi:dinuclear metal center YbgI/SA1388 family protein